MEEKLKKEIDNYLNERNNLINEIRQIQLKRMYERGEIEIGDNTKKIRFDNGEIDFEISIYLDNYTRELNLRTLREEFTEDEKEYILEAINY